MVGITLPSAGLLTAALLAVVWGAYTREEQQRLCAHRVPISIVEIPDSLALPSINLPRGVRRL